MPETVSIPLSVLNNIPGVGGVEDVEFTIQNSEDIREVVEEAAGGGDELRDVLQDELADFTLDTELEDPFDVPELAAEIGDEIGEIDTGEISRELATDLVEAQQELDIQIEGLFGPTQQDLEAFGETIGEEIGEIEFPEEREARNLSIPELEAVARGNEWYRGVSRQNAENWLVAKARGEGPPFDRPGNPAGQAVIELQAEGFMDTRIYDVEAVDVNGGEFDPTIFQGAEDYVEAVKEDKTTTDPPSPAEAVDTAFEGVKEILKLLTGEAEQLFTDPADFFEDIIGELLGPIGGIDFLDEPVRWVGHLLDESFALLVSDESLNNLEQAVGGDG